MDVFIEFSVIYDGDGDGAHYPQTELFCLRRQSVSSMIRFEKHNCPAIWHTDYFFEVIDPKLCLSDLLA